MEKHILILGIFVSILTGCNSQVEVSLNGSLLDSKTSQGSRLGLVSISNKSHKSFNVSVGINYGSEEIGLVRFYICNDSLSANCDPLDGSYVLLVNSGDKYTGSIDSLTGAGDNYNYKVVAIDLEGNHSTQSEGSFSLDEKPGSPFEGFGSGGVATLDLKSANVETYEMLIQSDDKMILVGRFNGESNEDFLIMRLNTDGTLDTSFNSTGYRIIDFSGNHDAALRVGQLSTGSYVIVGRAGNGTDNDAAIAIVDQNGLLDTSFNSTGLMTIDSGNGSDSAEGLFIDGSDNIFIGGSYHDGTSQNFMVAKMNAAGILDNTFDTDGMVTTDIRGTGNDWIQDLELDSLGNLVAAGTSRVSSTDSDPALASYNLSTGALIAGFGTAGTVQLGIGTEDQATIGLEFNPDGTFLIGVTADIGAGSARHFYKFLSDGTLDTTWQTSGLRSEYGACCQMMQNLKLLSDGRFMVASKTYGSGIEFAVDMHLANGELDSSFDGDGRLIFNLSGEQSTEVVGENSAGDLFAFGNDYRKTLGIKFDGTGTLDTNFGESGYLWISLSGGVDDITTSILAQNQDLIFGGNNAQSVLAGSMNLSGEVNNNFSEDGGWTGDISCCRKINGSLYLSTGEHITVGKQWGTGNDFHVEKWDASYNRTGSVLIDVTGGEEAFAAVEQPDGKIIIIGDAGGDIGLARINNDLSLDATFGTAGVVRLDIGGNQDYARDIVLLNDGSFIVVGSTNTGTHYDTLVLKFQSDGSLDPTFGTAGILQFDFGGITETDNAYGVSKDNSENILIAGRTYTGSDWDIAISFIDSNGNFISSFGTNGKNSFDILGFEDRAFTVAYTGEYFVVGGYTNDGTDYEALAMGINPENGQLLTDFGDNGSLVYDLSGNTDMINDIQITSDGGIIFTGFGTQANGDQDALALKLHQ